MEILKTHCNVDKIKVDSGIYKIQKVINKQLIPSDTWCDIHGSSIHYKAQSSSNKLNYIFNTHIIGDHKNQIKCHVRTIINSQIVNIKTFLINPMEEKPITGYLQVLNKERPFLWDKIHTFKTQILIETSYPNSAFLHYTTTIINRRFAATFTVPYICVENIHTIE